MMQSSLVARPASALHVAIIMDGNGRWATAQGQTRSKGHEAGARALGKVIEAAPDLGIETLTLFAFSADNWQRPQGEVAALMRLFTTYLSTEAATCAKRGGRLSIVGRRDRLPATLRKAIEAAETATVRGRKLRLRIALDYSARDAIVEAARSLGACSDPAPTRETFARLLGEANHDGISAPDVDLLIRTGGEQRLSDFLLWECAYAELVFSPKMWPDFTPADLEAAVAEFHSRQRRFGRVLEPAS